MDWYEEQKKAEACVSAITSMAEATNTDGVNALLGITRDRLVAIRETSSEAIKHLDASKKIYDEETAAAQ
jgi:hypothetical protein